MYVIKANGEKEEFDKSKIIRTCLRMGASRELAEEIASEVEKRAYDGIPTKEILKTILKLLEERYHPAFKHREDLRSALSLLRPKPDFEQYVRIVLRELGYFVLPNQIIRGKCLEYELDGIIEKDDKRYMLEVKHHVNPHTPTGLEVCLAVHAKLLDINEGYRLGLTTVKLDGAIIVCNTKFSYHARKYAECAGLMLLGWNHPSENGLSTIIEKKKLYPITCIKGFSRDVYAKLAEARVLLLRQVAESPLEELTKITGLDEDTLRLLKDRALKIMSIY
ncbi:MAG: restriction endonuclease [Thermoprotei archaeon]|mgnify:CR=1 FL=1|nr:MAG: restriction endonuclease [Thermoprotei archaeon]